MRVRHQSRTAFPTFRPMIGSLSRPVLRSRNGIICSLFNMHPLDRFARQVERRPKRSFKYCSVVHLSALILVLTSCQSFAPLSWIKKEPIYLEKMTPSNQSLINSDPDTYKYKDNDEYLPPIDLRKKPDVLAGI